MAIVFHSGGDQADRRGTAPDPVALPRHVLNRHRARILDPQTAATFAGAPAPRSTIYRGTVLQLPNSLLGQADTVELINGVLAGVGYRLAVERVPALRDLLPDALLDYLDYFPDVQRRVPLVVVPGATARPVDSWLALQELRAAAVPGSPLSGVIGRIELEHLLVGSRVLEGDPSIEGHPQTGPASYALPGSGGRAPVDLVAPAPPRRPIGDIGGRRPMIALLDTGVGTHPWLDRSPKHSDDSFVLLDPAMQALIENQEQSDKEPEILSGWTDAPVYESVITGELDTHSGHGSFIAGVIRQACPDARVRSIRLMHDDGVMYENDLHQVLTTLLAQVRAAQAGAADGSFFVDVVSLSAGYYSEDPADATYTSMLAALLGELTACGVPIVASAGNDSTDRPCYPAALSQAPAPGTVPLALGVGALNPNGSKAFFSNDGQWVDYWATGAAVVSVLPIDFNGSESPQNSLRETTTSGERFRRQTIDPDDYRSGFATWSGTSFAAPLVAAELAGGLLDAASNNPALSLPLLDATTACARVVEALGSVPG